MFVHSLCAKYLGQWYIQKSVFKFHYAAEDNIVSTKWLLFLHKEDMWNILSQYQTAHFKLYCIFDFLNSIVSSQDKFWLCDNILCFVAINLHVSFFSIKPQIYKKQMFSKRNLFGLIFTPDFLCGPSFYVKKNRPWLSLQVLRTI